MSVDPAAASSDPSPRDLDRLRRHAAAAEHAGWLLPAQQAVMHRRGWLKLLVPRALGGAEMPLPELVRLEERVAASDGSCGWAFTLCAGAGWFAGFLPPGLARRIVSTPRCCIAGSGAPTGWAERAGAGWRIGGRWAHASGAPMATHFTLVTVLRDAAGVLRDGQGLPRTRAFIVPAADVVVEPGWFATGMRASGSFAYRLDQAWVPDAQGFDIAPQAATAPGPLYRFPFLALAWVTLAANLAGLARHFVALADPLIRQRRPLRSATPLGDDPGMRQRLADCGGRLAQAWQALLAELDQAWSTVASGAPLPAAAEQRLQQRAMGLVEASRSAVDALYPCCGLQAADSRSEINRVWRDFHTASQHGLLVPGA